MTIIWIFRISNWLCHPDTFLTPIELGRQNRPLDCKFRSERACSILCSTLCRATVLLESFVSSSMGNAHFNTISKICGQIIKPWNLLKALNHAISRQPYKPNRCRRFLRLCAKPICFRVISIRVPLARLLLIRSPRAAKNQYHVCETSI